MNNNFSDSPAQTLAETGGAPLLAHVIMGADPKDVLAGYFGSNNYDEWLKTLPDDQSQLVEGVRKQLTSIQSNTDMRNQAVQQVINDFPNIAAQAAKARQASGDEFDDMTKGYIDQALNGTSARLAAGGNLSSGAAAAAMAKVGADYGMDKLDYMDSREAVAYKQGAQGLQGWQAKLKDATDQRTQQQDMLLGSINKGYKAQNNAEKRAFGLVMDPENGSAILANKLQLADQKNQAALFGTLGRLGSTVIRGSMTNKSNGNSNLFGSTQSPTVPGPTDQIDLA